ncbi:MAG TPA: GAF domain-containing protein [Ktedonobacterales bacterium]|jgi:DNA-binding transcriptional MerR regulator|nr:GAF domain-containing protein [Ktedonobacterales bacterium]
MTKRERQAETSKRFHHIGDVVTLTGLSADALRAWERVGLLAPQRSAGGVRQYTEDDVARIRLIARTLQRGGFSRAAVAMLLQSGDLQPDAADYVPGPAHVRPSPPRARAPDAADEQRRDRRMLAAIARISDALASRRAIAEVLEVICAETCWAFGVSDATIWLAEPFPAHHAGEPETRTGFPSALVVAAASGQHHSGAPSIPSGGAHSRSVPLDDQRFPPARAFLARRSLVVTTQDLSERAHPELAGMLPGAALLSMPLLAADGVALGVLVLQEASDIERFSADELERIRLFAAHAALAIQTARLHVAIQTAQRDADDQRARWQSAVDNLPALVCITDTALHITYVSPTCQETLGWPAAPRSATDPIGQSTDWVTDHGFFWLDGAAPVAESLTPDQMPLPRALRERQPVHDIIVFHRRADGTERLITWDAAPMPAASGQLLGAIAFGRDVTAERRLRAREASLAAVTQAALESLASGSVERSAIRILTAMVSAMPTPPFTATLYLWDDQAGALKRVCDVGGERGGAHTPAIPIAPRHPWWQEVAASPNYSTHDRERPHWLRAMSLATWEASGIRSWATVPLRADSALVGALAIALGASYIWDDAERLWLEACAAAITMAVEHGRILRPVGHDPRP